MPCLVSALAKRTRHPLLVMNVLLKPARVDGLRAGCRLSSVVERQLGYCLSMLEAPLFAIGLGMTLPLLLVFAAS